MKAAAWAALGEMPAFAGCALEPLGVKFGVKAGESTLSDFFALPKTTQPTAKIMEIRLNLRREAIGRDRAEIMIEAARACTV